MAQFVLKIELLSHIMGTTPILEMARAYGLRSRLWLMPILSFRGMDINETRLEVVYVSFHLSVSPFTVQVLIRSVRPLVSFVRLCSG